jgi:peptidyl-prolyl cis-trans isomerase A (cyclophilin A)
MKIARRTALVVVTLALGALAAIPYAQQAPSAKLDLTKPELFTEKAPDVYMAQFDATFGTFIVKVTRNWAPNAADRFYNLVKNGYYDDNRFYRVIPDVLAQFGINGTPAISQAWLKAFIKQDRARMSNTRGRLSFAAASGAATDQNTRSTQVFINFADNSKMDQEGFAAFGEITTSMVMVQRIFDKYGEGVDPVQILTQGNAWLMQNAPQLSYIKTATIIPATK